MKEGKKIIARHQFSVLRRARDAVVKNWCLKRSRLIYAVASRCMTGAVRINVAMRCREDTSSDWGHAWVTCDDTPVCESDSRLITKPMTKIADNGKYIYWIYD